MLLNGEPAGDLEVSVEHAGATSDAEGRVTLPAFPGSRNLFVSKTVDRWKFQVPTPVLVVSNQNISSRVLIELVTGRLTCLDGEGAPLADQSLTLYSLDVNGQMLSATWPKTDAAGQLDLSLPVGEYGLGRGVEDQPQVFSWTAAGPRTLTIQQ